MTEIFSQLHTGAEICKYVFGSVTVTMFSCCFFSFLNLKLFITTLKERKKKKETVCKSSQIFQREQIGHKVQLLYPPCFTQQNLKCLGENSKSKL